MHRTKIIRTFASRLKQLDVMKLKNLLLVVLLALTSSVMAQMQMPSVPVDPDVKIGKLDNGLTYYIRYNNWPEHRANFYIAQKVGSIQEEESQRGLAHFLEHMCFNGSDNFKGNEIVSWCEKNGIQFGSDLNAYTSIDQTVYRISNVPTARQSVLDSCLLVLRDWADGLTLDPAEIDKERGVIHEEWRMRTSASSRMFERNLPALYPGSKYGLRYPIGLMSVIDNFKPKELRDYYEKWYHPANQGIIVVGDVDIEKTEAKIKELFGPIKNPDVIEPIVDEPVPDNAEPIVIIDQDKEQRTSEVDIFFKHDAFPDSLKGSMAYMVYNYVMYAALGMLNSRFTEAAQKEDCPYVSAYAGDDDYIYAKTKAAFSLSATPKDLSKIAESLKAMLVEARKASEFGFTSTEYDRYKADYLSSLEKSYANKDKRTNAQLYNPLVGNFLTNEPMPSIDYTYETMKQLVPAIPLQVINEMMKEFVPANDSNMVVINFNNEAEGNVYPTKDGLLNAVREARAMPIEAFVDNVKNEPLIAQMPKPGKIKKEIKNDKFGYTELQLSNGATVILKQTDFKKDQVMLTGEGFGGESLYGEKDYTNLKVFDDVIGISGLGNFSSTELEKALAGKIANANLTMDGDKYMGVNGSSTPKDVETMLQMLYLYFTKINKDEKSFQKLMGQYEVALKNRSLSPDVALSDSLTATIYGHDLRKKPLLLEDLKNINYDRILQIASERTATAQGWTFRIIGNFDEATIRPLICQYIASLPGKGKIVKGKRTANLQKGKIDNIFQRKQETPKANAYMIWFSEDMPYTPERDIQASIAGQIMRMVYTKEIREEASAAYSVSASGAASISDDYHVMQLVAYCPMQPDKKEIALQLLSQAVTNLSNTCDVEMLNKCKEVMLKRYDENVKNNGYWNNIIYTWKKYGMDEHTNYKELVQSQTPEKISAFVRELISAGNHISVIMLPEE